jgi:hypothetical protein
LCRHQGRFLREDPLSFTAGDTNLYRYVFNSPTNAVDPTGQVIRFAVSLAFLGVGAAVGFYGLAADNYDSATGLMSRPPSPQRDEEIRAMITRARYQEAAGDVAFWTGVTWATSYPLGMGAGYIWTAWGTTGKVLVSARGVYGGAKLVDDGIWLLQNDRNFDGPERLRQWGSFLGSCTAGSISGARGWRAGAVSRPTIVVEGRPYLLEVEGRPHLVLELEPEQSWGLRHTLERQFVDHGRDFGAQTQEEYARLASLFLQDAPRRNLPIKIDKNGIIRIYDPTTNTFGSYNPNGTTRTFFKPEEGINYWLRQHGDFLYG